MMKTGYVFLFAALVLLMNACKQPEVRLERKDLKLFVPERIDMSDMVSSTLTSEQMKAIEDSVVATFKWTNATSLGDDYTFTYLFQIDIADNNFATAVPAIEIPVGQDSINLTAGYFYENVVERWGKEAKTEVKLEARIVARVEGPTFEYPEIASETFDVLTFRPASIPLYAVGSVFENGVEEMEETSNGRRYYWSGELKVGELYFTEEIGTEYPSLQMLDTTILGAPQDTFLVWRENANDLRGKPFTVKTEGLYEIVLHKRDMNVWIRQMSDEMLYIIGDGVVGACNESSANQDWDPSKYVVMRPNPKNIQEFIAVVELRADGINEDKFKIATEPGKWEATFYRPTTADAPISDGSIQLNAGDPDNKWKVSQADNGTYKITLNTDPAAMSIKFERQ